jgi:nuclear pore complex protein Nup155
VLCWCLGAGGVTEDLSAVLSGGCPSYFKEDDKTFYQASGLLQRGEATTATAEREHLTREALRLMMKACFCPVPHNPLSKP